MRFYGNVRSNLQDIIVYRRGFPGSIIRMAWDNNEPQDFDTVPKARKYLKDNYQNITRELVIELFANDGRLLAKSTQTGNNTLVYTYGE